MTDLCVCGHAFSSHADGNEVESDLAALTSRPSGNIYKSEPRGKTRCSECDCLTLRPADSH